MSETMQYDEQLMREVIMDHYQHPRNHELVNDANYLTVRLKNPSCGDDLTLQCLFSDNPAQIKSLLQSGQGCSICCASASMLTELLQNSSVLDAELAIKEFSKMLQGEPFQADLLGDAQTLAGISKVIPRIKCANLAWQACQSAINAWKNNQTPTKLDIEINE